MSRPLRIFLPDISVHVIQRGNDHMAIFRESRDQEVFLSFVVRALRTHQVALHGYVLMTTHVHFIVTPGEKSSLPKMMQQLGGHYVRYFNRKYERTGTLWNGRYRAFLLTDERYWLTCLRYVEQNPVRAGMETHPADYGWSSYGAHAFGNWPNWLTPHDVYTSLGATPEQRQRAYRTLCGSPLHNDELVVARQPLTQVTR